MRYHELSKLRARAVVLAEGKLGELTGKTCNILVMYSGWRRVEVRYVIDSRHAGEDAGNVIGVGKTGIPVISSLEDVVDDVDTLIIGISPVGGRLPEEYRRIIIEAVKRGLNVWSGLHVFISDDPEIAKLAQERGVSLVDFRKPPRDLRIWNGSVLKTCCARVLVAGTDCSVGKNVTCIEVVRELEKRGFSTGLVGTGQTMLMVGADAGTVVDAVPADFVPGEVERHVLDLDNLGKQIVVVEGQAALLHPAYAQVTLGIYYGSMPHVIVLCHDPWRETRESFDYLRMPDLKDEIRAIKAHLPDVVIAAISVMGMRRSDEEVREACEKIERELGILAADPRRDVRKLVDSLLDNLRRLGLA